MSKPLITINDFSGGATLNNSLGGANNYEIGTQLDYWTQPGRLTLVPGSTPLTLSGLSDLGAPVQAMTESKGENSMFVSLDVTAGGSLDFYKGVNTLTAEGSVLNRTILSMDEYYGEVIAVSDTGDTWVTNDGGSGTTGFNSETDLWSSSQDFFDGVALTAHQVDAIDRHYFTANQYVASVNGDPTSSGNYDATAFDLTPGWRSRALAPYGDQYLAIAANFHAGQTHPSRGRIVIWDGVQTVSSYRIDVPENYIKAIYSLNGYLWIWAGKACNLYVNAIGSQQVTLVHRFFNSYPNDVSFDVYPHAVAHKEGRIYFGLSNVDSNSANYNPGGIYSFEANPNRFNIDRVYTAQTSESVFKSLIVVQQEDNDILYYSEETNAGGSFVFRQRLFSSDSDIYSTGSTATLKTITYEAPPGSKLHIDKVTIETEPLPAGVSISINANNEDGGSFSYFPSGYQTDGDEYGVDRGVIRGRKVYFTVDIITAFTTLPVFIRRIVAYGNLIPDNK